jgi:hypothetical protein
MPMMLTEDEQQHARWAFRRGSACLMIGKCGDMKALSEAIIYLTITLEWVMPETWPGLWHETRVALNEALWLRGKGGDRPCCDLDA